MAQINNIILEPLDPPDVDQTEFGPDMKRWLSNIVDIINASFATLSQTIANLIAVGQIDIGGSGAGPITVSVTGLNSSNYVTVTLVSSSNPNIEILSVIPAANSFNITFSADPGASAIIAYQAYTQQPQ